MKVVLLQGQGDSDRSNCEGNEAGGRSAVDACGTEAAAAAAVARETGARILIATV